MKLKKITRHLISPVMSVIFLATQTFANPKDNLYLSDLSDITEGISENSDDSSKPENIREITVPEVGTLRDVLGNEILSIEAMAITGPLNEDDFKALWESTFFGVLKYLDLSNSFPTENKLPENAFYKYNFDYEVSQCSNPPDDGRVKLQQILLPEGLLEIGDNAFAYAESLKTINLPNSLIKIGNTAFKHCINLSADPLVLPENLVHFRAAFLDCSSLAGEVVLPESMTKIDHWAFGRCPINRINITDKIKWIGCCAFENSQLSEVILAEDCDIHDASGLFWRNKNLSELHIPDEAKLIPDDFCSGCISLTQVNLPRELYSIGERAFDLCPLEEIDFPSSLRLIYQHAFRGANFTKITLPANLNEVMSGSFGDCENLREVYCLAATPPHCTQLHETSPNPFARCSPDLVIYVPKGSGELYRNARGWGENQNIVEKDMSGVEMINPFSGGAPVLFDLNGRRVATPGKGQVIIENGKKYIKSE